MNTEDRIRLLLERGDADQISADDIDYLLSTIDQLRAEIDDLRSDDRFTV